MEHKRRLAFNRNLIAVNEALLANIVPPAACTRIIR